jgi:hypothetical protein
MGILGALGILFVGLKLAGFIAWSWWWVTLPFWGLFALMFATVIVAGGFAVFLDSLENRKLNKKHKTPWSH